MIFRETCGHSAHQELGFIHADRIAPDGFDLQVRRAVEELDLRMFDGCPQRIVHERGGGREDDIIFVSDSSCNCGIKCLIRLAVVKLYTVHQISEILRQRVATEFVAVDPAGIVLILFVNEGKFQRSCTGINRARHQELRDAVLAQSACFRVYDLRVFNESDFRITRLCQEFIPQSVYMLFETVIFDGQQSLEREHGKIYQESVFRAQLAALSSGLKDAGKFVICILEIADQLSRPGRLKILPELRGQSCVTSGF